MTYRLPTARRGTKKTETSAEVVHFTSVHVAGYVSKEWSGPDHKPTTIMRRLMEEATLDSASELRQPVPRPCPMYIELADMVPRECIQMCVDTMSIGPLVAAIGIKPALTAETLLQVSDYFREHKLYQNPDSPSHRQRGIACWFICRVVESADKFDARIEATREALEILVQDDDLRTVRYTPFTQYYGVYLKVKKLSDM